MTSKAGQVWWTFLAGLLVLAVWLCATGQVWLHGFPLEVLESLASGKNLLLPTSEMPGRDGQSVLGALPGEAVLWTSAFIAITNTLAALSLYFAGRWSWRNPISPTLATGLAFFGTSTMWLKTESPKDSLLHLLLALSLAALVNGAVPVLAGLVLALTVMSPAQGITMFLALAYLGYRRQSAYGLILPTVATFSVGCLLIPMAAEYRLSWPGHLVGWQTISLLPVLLCLLVKEVRAARGGIYLTLLIGSALTGVAELASVLAVGDLAFLALNALSSEKPPLPRTGGWLLSGVGVVSVLASLLFLWSILPGERHLNRHILIPAQKSDVPLTTMLSLFSLQNHATSYGSDSWRARRPFPELSAADFGMALDLAHQTAAEGFCPITLDDESESRKVALLYALLSGQPLRGWDDAQHLSAPLLLSKLRRQNFLHLGPTVIFRQQGQARIQPGPDRPKTLTPLDFRNALMLPYRIQQVSAEAGTAYRWSSAGQLFELSFVDTPAELVFSSRPGEYRISSLAQNGAIRHFEVPPLLWEISGIPSEETLPSRSLVPLALRLSNRGEGPISSDLIASWQVGTTTGTSFSPFLQRAAKDFILYPGESTELELQLATPEPEGEYVVDIKAITPEGKVLKMPLSGPATVRTWRRLPPVGTWVEEP